VRHIIDLSFTPWTIYASCFPQNCGNCLHPFLLALSSLLNLFFLLLWIPYGEVKEVTSKFSFISSNFFLTRHPIFIGEKEYYFELVNVHGQLFYVLSVYLIISLKFFISSLPSLI
jgi:hypothetical protein